MNDKINEIMLSIAEARSDLDVFYRSKADELVKYISGVFKKIGFNLKVSNISRNYTIVLTHAFNDEFYVSTIVKSNSNGLYRCKFSVTLNGCFVILRTNDIAKVVKTINKLFKSLKCVVKVFHDHGFEHFTGFRRACVYDYYVWYMPHDLRIMFNSGMSYPIGKHGILPDDLIYHNAFVDMVQFSNDDHVGFAYNNRDGAVGKFFVFMWHSVKFIFDGVSKMYVCETNKTYVVKDRLTCDYTEVFRFDLNKDELEFVSGIIGSYLSNL